MSSIFRFLLIIWLFLLINNFCCPTFRSFLKIQLDLSRELHLLNCCCIYCWIIYQPVCYLVACCLWLFINCIKSLMVQIAFVRPFATFDNDFNLHSKLRFLFLLIFLITIFGSSDALFNLAHILSIFSVHFNQR